MNPMILTYYVYIMLNIRLYKYNWCGRAYCMKMDALFLLLCSLNYDHEIIYGKIKS